MEAIKAVRTAYYSFNRKVVQLAPGQQFLPCLLSIGGCPVQQNTSYNLGIRYVEFREETTIEVIKVTYYSINQKEDQFAIFQGSEVFSSEAFEVGNDRFNGKSTIGIDTIQKIGLQLDNDEWIGLRKDGSLEDLSLLQLRHEGAWEKTQIGDDFDKVPHRQKIGWSILKQSDAALNVEQLSRVLQSLRMDGRQGCCDGRLMNSSSSRKLDLERVPSASTLDQRLQCPTPQQGRGLLLIPPLEARALREWPRQPRPPGPPKRGTLISLCWLMRLNDLPSVRLTALLTEWWDLAEQYSQTECLRRVLCHGTDVLGIFGPASPVNICQQCQLRSVWVQQ
ncbi:hypothetical protein PGT21_005270 [Puccinia graminis f. sp. tritici]|uniref:Uncharacterized protein n=1 Tax=Puccinia graminis f. sp. tritici TaxID=56615 RepID=A0A5B0PTJ5_PUCGR|nr:hypothetical protein PGT21_005270 [Puccinia graminis f. sp. tritici]